MFKAKIAGTGSVFPPQVIDNEMIMPLVKAKDPEAWNQKTCERMFGVKTRRWATDFKTGELMPGWSDIGMSVKAANNALEMAELKGSDLDLIIHTAAIPDYWVDPDPAVEIGRELGTGINCAAMTIAITCVGITHGIIMASAYIKAGLTKNVLLTTSNTYSAIPKKSWQMLFFVGDAAASIVLSATDADDESGIIGSYWGSHHGMKAVHSHYNTLQEKNPGPFESEFFPEAVAKEGAPLYGRAVKALKENHPDITPDRVISHQANTIFQRFASKQFGIPMEKVPFNLPDYGNTLGPSCGTVLDWQIREGNVKRGDTIAAIAVGSGWHWSSCFMKY